MVPCTKASVIVRTSPGDNQQHGTTQEPRREGTRCLPVDQTDRQTDRQDNKDPARPG